MLGIVPSVIGDLVLLAGAVVDDRERVAGHESSVVGISHRYERRAGAGALTQDRGQRRQAGVGVCGPSLPTDPHTDMIDERTGGRRLRLRAKGKAKG